MWCGRGQGGFPAPEDYHFAQEIVIRHDGRPFLIYESRAWLLDDESKPAGEAVRELGFWRPVLVDGRPGDEMEATMMTQDGVMELYLGKATGTRLEMATDAVVRSPSSTEVTAGHRLFGIVEGALLYAHEMAGHGQGLSPHLSARLVRVGG
jgi:hypothetical protein